MGAAQFTFEKPQTAIMMVIHPTTVDKSMSFVIIKHSFRPTCIEKLA